MPKRIDDAAGRRGYAVERARRSAFVPLAVPRNTSEREAPELLRDAARHG